ncbi:MAG: methyltransferase domain-containing protein [Mariprofundus sp.]|nr:methyltransferase domain-containing protein [Mariprofundus sp.]
MLDWEALYQNNDTGWDRGGVSPALQIWLRNGALEQRSRVLIPGCGRGHEVVALAKQDFDVTGIDIAPTAIACLKQTLASEKVKATALLNDLFTYQPEQSFDVVYEQTCLCAIDPEQRAAYVQQLRIWLRPGGTLLLSMMQTGETGGPPYHCDWIDMQGLFPSQHWQWQADEPFIVPRWRPSPRFELGFRLVRV